MPTTTTTPALSPDPDLAAVKFRQQAMWASGDFSVIASRIVLVAELLADSADLRAGSTVLDVACGNGNAAIAAARSGTRVVGVDYVPALLEDGRGRALAEGLDVEFRLGDAEDLPVETSSVDAALSVFGSMFAPDQQRTADELVRAVRPGGTVGLASWTPDGYIGAMLRVVSAYVPPPAGVASPLLWGTESHLAGLFGPALADMRSQVRHCVFRATSPEALVATFRRWYGPTVTAFGALAEPDRVALAADLAALARDHDVHRDGGSIAVPAAYLETVLTVR